jgi:chemotaxis response regulator CheB
MLLSFVSGDFNGVELKRVLVIKGRHLIADGILSLLTRELDLDVFDATFRDEITVLEEIKVINPEVLVMDASSPFTNSFLFLSLLNDCPDLRVIVIDERKNLMRIYEKQELVVARVADLFAAIREEEQPFL